MDARGGAFPHPPLAHTYFSGYFLSSAQESVSQRNKYEREENKKFLVLISRKEKKKNKSWRESVWRKKDITVLYSSVRTHWQKMEERGKREAQHFCGKKEEEINVCPLGCRNGGRMKGEGGGGGKGSFP